MAIRKAFVEALDNGVNQTLFFENATFAFQGKRAPVDYPAYLRRTVQYAQEYGMDAVHVFFGFEDPVSVKGNLDAPEQLRHISTTPDELAGHLAALKTDVAMGVNHKAPFSILVDDWQGGDEYGVMSFLLALEEDYRGIVKHPEIMEGIERNTEAVLQVAKTLEGKADFLVLAEPSGSTNHIAPHHFEKYVLPSYQRLTSETSLPIVLHLPGKIILEIPYLKDSGIRAVKPVDEDDLGEVLNEMAGAMPVFGNVNQRLFTEGSRAALKRDFDRCVESHGGPWVVRSSFWIPYNADVNKVAYLADLVRKAR